MDDFMERYGQTETLGLNVYVLPVGGTPTTYCVFMFSNPVLQQEFTQKMAEMFGTKLLEHEYFLQKDLSGKVSNPLPGESKFDLQRGNLYSIRPLQSEDKFLEAVRMVSAVASALGIKVVEMRTKTNKNGEEEHAFTEYNVSGANKKNTLN